MPGAALAAIVNCPTEGWEPSSGPLGEPDVLLTSEASLKPLKVGF